MAFHPTTYDLYVGSGNNITVCNTTNGTHLILNPHNPNNSHVTSLAFHPITHRLFLGSDDGTITICSPDNRSYFRGFKAHNSPVTCLAFDPITYHLYSGSNKGTIKVWNPAQPYDDFVEKYTFMRWWHEHNYCDAFKQCDLTSKSQPPIKTPIKSQSYTRLPFCP